MEKPVESVENLDKSMLLAQNDRVYSRKNGGAFYAKKRQKRRNGKMKKRRFYASFSLLSKFEFRCFSSKTSIFLSGDIMTDARSPHSSNFKI